MKSEYWNTDFQTEFGGTAPSPLLLDQIKLLKLIKWVDILITHDWELWLYHFCLFLHSRHSNEPLCRISIYLGLYLPTVVHRTQLAKVTKLSQAMFIYNFWTIFQIFNLQKANKLKINFLFSLLKLEIFLVNLVPV